MKKLMYYLQLWCLMNRYKIVYIVVVTLCLLCVAPTMQAQRKGMEKLRHRVEDLRKVKLIDLLNLQGDQVEKFFSAYARLQNGVITAKDGMDEASRDLHQAAVANANEGELKTKTDALLAAMQTLERAINSRHSELRPILSPLQYAKYLAFEARFQEELQRMILQRARKRGGMEDNRGGPEE